MASEVSNASWHPAFMPNSMADVHPISSPQLSLSPIQTQESVSEPQDNIPIEPVPDPTGSSVQQDDLMNEDAEELAWTEESTGPFVRDNIHDAPASSSENPKEEDLGQNQECVQDYPLNDQDGSSQDIPVKESRHLSTTSFARTVPHEMNWAEDDNGKQEWNIQRKDTDPFKFMAKTERINSYPAVPQTPASPPHQFEQPLSHSQVENILNEVEHEPRDMFSDGKPADEADFSAQQAALDEDPRGNTERTDQRQESAQNSEGYGQSYGGDFQQEEDSDSQTRYEEGVPLVQSNDEGNAEPQELPETQPSFMDETVDDDNDFFSQVSKQVGDTSQKFPPHPVERKSRTQVMKSLDFEPAEQASDLAEEYLVEKEVEKEETEITQSMITSTSSLEKATGSGIGVSASTVLSAVLGDPSAPIHNEPENLAALEMESGDGDLAAKWKAALEGDDFLDDDELSADEDETGDKAVDPAAFFGSDDGGFLEDTEGQNDAVGTPVLAPVTDPNGNVIGFDRLSRSAVPSRPGSSGNSRYVPAGAGPMVPQQPANPYAPAAPLLTDLLNPAGVPAGGPSQMSMPPFGSYPGQYIQQQPRPDLPKAQSFANKAKGGYTSPYDLPMEVVKPRKRTSMQQVTRNASSPTTSAPPPRSGSANAIPPPPRTSTSSLSPPQSSHSNQPSQLQQAKMPISPLKPVPPKPKPAQHGFFEDSPVTSRPKPCVRNMTEGASSPRDLYSPPISGQTQSPRFSHPVQQLHQPPMNQSASTVSQGLVAPERVSAYAPLSENHVPPPAAAIRYSPAPMQTHSQTAPPPVSQSRYSPAPAAPRQSIPGYAPPSANASPTPLLHQPRTSSPLAHFERNQERRLHQAVNGEIPSDQRNISSVNDVVAKGHPLQPPREVSAADAGRQRHSNHVEPQKPYPSQYGQTSPGAPRSRTRTPPQAQMRTTKKNLSPSRTASNYTQQPPTTGAAQSAMTPPKRSQTQSPGTAFAGPRLQMNSASPYQRPASTEVPLSPKGNNDGFAPMLAKAPRRRSRGLSQNFTYLPPVDGRELDPLQRWKGCPVFVWGVGGVLVTSFPKDVPRYGMGQAVPTITRCPGEVKISNITDIGPLEERLTSFPGPLKGKAKKKEIVAWLSSGLQNLERNAMCLRTASTLSHEDKRTGERILLWKILRAFIEHDGVLEGSTPVEKAVRAVLSPGLDDNAMDPFYATGAELSGISKSGFARADSLDPVAVDQLRKHLLRGEKENAVWEAVDKRLWAHAMLISSTVSKELYKQVSQEFVQKEVKSVGENTESLAALYDVFAGNFEESVDELVPPSARAGFQLVSTSKDGEPSKDALDGLDRWRETLGLILSNRSTDDSQALKALGKLLAGYGRAEAAHICFMFARSMSVFSGIDDPASNIVLVGSDQLRQPYDFDRELEPALLSEVYEFGLSLSSTSSASSSVSHLAVYKLQHAMVLAEYGHREKALQYCESIASSITSQTRRSPYHHSLLVSYLDDLSKRLKQSPKDGSSSWISKPSMDKVSGSVWATFNKFVAGGEADTTASTPVSNPEIGPFARIAGATPSISREPSNSDLYSACDSGAGINGSLPPMTRTLSRYAPGGTYTPPSYEPQANSSSGSQPQSSFESRTSGEHRRGQYEPQRYTSRSSSQPPNSAASMSSHPTPHYAPSYPVYAENDSPYVPQGSQIPTPPVAPVNDFSHPLHAYDGQQMANSYSPPDSSHGPQRSSYEARTSSGYEPPSTDSYDRPSSGYEPPSYEPAMMNDEPMSPPQPKKKSFMDDDDNDIPGLRAPAAAAAREKTKAKKDRQADEAFRRAAEEDAKKAAPAQAPKKGWLGGWFAGGSKKEPTETISQPNKPIRAKLGEANSFYYDSDQKRWVNKKAGAESAPTPTATPPPPRAAGPPRTVSNSGGPPSPVAATVGHPPSLPRSVSSAPSLPPSQRTPSGSSAQSDGPAPPGPMEGALLKGLSRAQSNASLNVSAGGPPSRPSSSMSKASDIDDLLGPASATARGKGTARGKKKGRGYIDVMGEKKG